MTGVAAYQTVWAIMGPVGAGVNWGHGEIVWWVETEAVFSDHYSGVLKMSCSLCFLYFLSFNFRVDLTSHRRWFIELFVSQSCKHHSATRCSEKGTTMEVNFFFCGQ